MSQVSRRRPPFRRPLSTVDLVWVDPGSCVEWNIAVGIGFDPGIGLPCEVFATLSKPGSLLGAMLSEACIGISRELQCGRQPADLLPRYGVTRDGLAMTPLGAVVGVLASEYAEALRSLPVVA